MSFMWNGCGTCLYMRRVEEQAFCVWCVKKYAVMGRTLAHNLVCAAALCRAYETPCLQLSTLQQRLAEVEEQWQHERDHSKMLSEANSALYVEKRAVENYCSKVRGELTDALTQRDLAIKERDELKQECERLRSQRDEFREAVDKWQPVIEAAKAWRVAECEQHHETCDETEGQCQVARAEDGLMTAISSALTPAADGQKEK